MSMNTHTHSHYCSNHFQASNGDAHIHTCSQTPPASNKNIKNEDGEVELPCVAQGELG